jgi:hypothetical protein
VRGGAVDVLVGGTVAVAGVVAVVIVGSGSVMTTLGG